MISRKALMGDSEFKFSDSSFQFKFSELFNSTAVNESTKSFDFVEVGTMMKSKLVLDICTSAD